MNKDEKRQLLKEFDEFLENKTDHEEIRVLLKNENPNNIKVGDTITFELKDGEEVSAMAMKKDEAGTLMVFVDCLEKEYIMNQGNTNKGGYEKSDLRKKLNGEILDRFPDSIKETMKRFDNGDYLRLLAEGEIFGKNYYGVKDDYEQLEPMKDRRNRIAFRGKGTDEWEWYWLQNSGVYSAATFAICGYYGGANNGSASYTCGVRPAFRI